IIGAQEFPFDSHRIASTQGTEAVDVRGSSVVRKRHGNRTTVARSKVEYAKLLINAVHSSVDHFTSSRARDRLRETRARASLNRFLYSDEIDVAPRGRS